MVASVVSKVRIPDRYMLLPLCPEGGLGLAWSAEQIEDGGTTEEIDPEGL